MFHANIESLDTRELYSCDNCGNGHLHINHVGDYDICPDCLLDFLDRQIAELKHNRDSNWKAYRENLQTIDDIIFELKQED